MARAPLKCSLNNLCDYRRLFKHIFLSVVIKLKLLFDEKTFSCLLVTWVLIVYRSRLTIRNVGLAIVSCLSFSWAHVPVEKALFSGFSVLKWGLACFKTRYMGLFRVWALAALYNKCHTTGILKKKKVFSLYQENVKHEFLLGMFS